MPDGDLVKRLRKVVVDGFTKSLKLVRHEGKSVEPKKLLILLSVGRIDKQPFDEATLEEVRSDMRIILREGAHGDGLPEEGDLVQAFEVRLLQSVLSACEDPDWYFCSWWARGVWLGSPKRKLPRTPAVFDRKTKWRWAEPTEDLQGEWQKNYLSH